MRLLSELCRRLAMLLRGERFDRDLQAEMRLHLELRQQEHVARGLLPADARAAAQRNFGNTTLLSEAGVDAWGWRSLEQFMQDLRYGSRALLRTPGFTLIAAITLALGIGTNTAIFSVVNAVLLRPLAYRDADRLVTLLHDGTNPVAVANYLDWRDQSHSFEAMGAAEYWSPNLSGVASPENLKGLHVTQSLLSLLGVAPSLGRLFAKGEDRQGADHEVVLSHRLWLRRFNSDRNVVGKQILLDSEAYNVIGVMPPEFKFAPFWATRAELWVPMAFGDRMHDRGGNSLRIFARLKPSVSLVQARAEIATVTARLEHQYPGTNQRVVVTPLKENVVGKVETPLLVMLGAVAFVLLISCANVAHMLLARTSDRQKEIAVRSALGASKRRLIVQFLTENLLLAFLGAGAGLLLALLGTKALLGLSPANLPRVETVNIDPRVVLFLLATTLLTAVAFGLAPALQVSAGNLAGSLKEGGRGDTDGIRRNRLRSFLVASEFALAFMLLIGAGLMVRSFSALRSVDPGFNPHNVLSMVVSVAGTQESESNRREIFYRTLLQKVGALPGVTAVSGINHLPLAGDLWGRSFVVEGRPQPRAGEAPTAVYRIVMPGYFETMRLPIRRGRNISGTDDRRAPGVVIINERAAREYWPGQNPVGKRLAIDSDGNNGPNWLTIVGVSEDAKQGDWAAEPEPEIYLAALQSPDFLGATQSHSSYITLVVRTAAHPDQLAAAVKSTVWASDRNLPISEVSSMDRVVADANAQPRFETLLMGAFAAIALLLAAVGIYGVMSYSVARRTREIGIRISLGASRADVLAMVTRQGMSQVLAGSGAGLVGALLLSKLMSKMLYGVPASDPLTFAGVAVILGLAALLATLVPARKAVRIEPMLALRTE